MSNQNDWIRWLPRLVALHKYRVSWLAHDVVAGLVLTTMPVLVGIAYAETSGLPGVNGLYAIIVPLLAYALFGPSRILVLGPDSALAAIILHNQKMCRHTNLQTNGSIHRFLPQK